MSFRPVLLSSSSGRKTLLPNSPAPAVSNRGLSTGSQGHQEAYRRKGGKALRPKAAAGPHFGSRKPGPRKDRAPHSRHPGRSGGECPRLCPKSRRKAPMQAGPQPHLPVPHQPPPWHGLRDHSPAGPAPHAGTPLRLAIPSPRSGRRRTSPRPPLTPGTQKRRREPSPAAESAFRWLAGRHYDRTTTVRVINSTGSAGPVGEPSVALMVTVYVPTGRALLSETMPVSDATVK